MMRKDLIIEEVIFQIMHFFFYENHQPLFLQDVRI